MSVLSDKITELGTAVSGVNTKISEVQASLLAEIQEIKDKIEAGGVTQADLDNLTALANSLTGTTSTLTQLDTDIKAIVP